MTNDSSEFVKATPQNDADSVSSVLELMELAFGNERSVTKRQYPGVLCDFVDTMSVKLQATRKFAAYSVPGTAPEVPPPAPAASKPAAAAKSKAAAPATSTASTATAAATGVDIEALILSTLATSNEIADTWEFAAHHQLDHQEIVGAIKSLLVDAYVVDQPLSATIWSVSDEGKDVLEKGSPEIQVLRAVSAAGSIAINTLNAQLGEVAKIGMGVCMKNKWIAKKGDNVEALVSDVKDDTAAQLQQVATSSGAGMNANDLNNLKKRKLVVQTTRKSYRITKGADFREKRVRKVADLTKAMLGKREEVCWSSTSYCYLIADWESAHVMMCVNVDG